MASVSVTTPKDLFSIPVLATGAGAVIPLVAGPIVAGSVAGLANIDVNNKGYMTALNVATKIGLGAVGTFLAKQGDIVGQVGLGMAVGGIAGALADIVIFGIAYATPVASTGAMGLERVGYGLVKGGGKRLPMAYAPMARGVQGLVAVPEVKSF